MKKPLLLLLVIAAVVGAGAFFYRRTVCPEGDDLHPEALLPSTTHLFVHLPNLPRTFERWQGTSLHDLAREPEWAAFAGQLPPDLPERLVETMQGPLALTCFRLWGTIAPAEIFWAQLTPADPGPGLTWLGAAAPSGLMLNSQSSSLPRRGAAGKRAPAAPMIIGIRYRGKKSAVEAAVETLRAEFFQGQAAPASVLLKTKGGEIEQVTSQGLTTAFAYLDDWILVSNSTKALQDLLARRADPSGSSGPNLAAEPRFAQAESQALPAPDLRIFKRCGETRRASKVAFQSLVSSMPDPDQKRATEMLNMLGTAGSAFDPYFPETFGYSFKFDGPSLRDRFYLGLPSLPPASPLSAPPGRCASPDAVAVGAVHIGGREPWLQKEWRLFREIVPDRGPSVGQVSREQVVRSGGLEPEFSEKSLPALEPVFSWQFGIATPRGLAAPSPSDQAFSSTVEVLDLSAARALMADWADQHGAFLSTDGEDQTAIIAISGNNYFRDQGLYRRGSHLVFGETREGIRMLTLLTQNQETLAQSAPFQAAMKTVPAPTVGWAYFDLVRYLASRTSTSQGTPSSDLHYLPGSASRSLSTPNLQNTFDFSKFPRGEPLHRHLQPTALSMGNAPGGLVIESAGSLPVGALVAYHSSWLNLPAMWW